MKTRILFVCLGNICRSPLAEGIFRSKASTLEIAERFEIDSAGLGNWHQGDPPDPRSIRIAAENGIDISRQKARQIETGDFDRFTMIFAMDRKTLRSLVSLAPHDSAVDMHLLADFVGIEPRDVPDPYYGDAEDFAVVFAMLDAGLDRLIDILVPADGR